VGTISLSTHYHSGLRTSDELFLASDGGAAACKGSFGCVLVTGDTVLLVGDRDILAFPFDRRQTQSTATLHDFYKWVKPLVNKSIHDANELGSRFRRLDSYFRTPVPPELFDLILI
jgi:vacuolar-type H+-ATPase catalytic subunit A/Vma1